MRKPKITMTIYKDDVGYSATGEIGERFMATMGETFEELKDMILECVNLAFEDLGFVYAIEEIKFQIDLKSFFEFYKVINAKALSQRIGMHQSLLAQYISGIKKPSPAQTKRILHGVQKLGRELADIEFLI
jgi:hypothetical protein